MHLIKFLNIIPSNDLNPLRKYCDDQISNWYHNGQIPLAADPDYDTIKNMWPNNISTTYEKIKLEHLSHKYLLYKFRCFLIHESRRPGYAMSLATTARTHGRNGHNTPAILEVSIQMMQYILSLLSLRIMDNHCLLHGPPLPTQPTPQTAHPYRSFEPTRNP